VRCFLVKLLHDEGWSSANTRVFAVNQPTRPQNRPSHPIILQPLSPARKKIWMSPASEKKASRRGRLAPVLSHHRTCGAAPGGSPGFTSRFIAFTQAEETLGAPVGAAQGSVHWAFRHSPRAFAAVGELTGYPIRESQVSQFPPSGPDPLPLHPDACPEPPHEPPFQRSENTWGSLPGRSTLSTPGGRRSVRAHSSVPKEAEPEEFAVPGPVHCAFLLVHPELESLLEESADAGHDPFACPAAAHIDVAVIGVACKAESPAFGLLVQVIERDIRQQWTERATLRCPLRCRHHDAICHDTGL